MRFSYLDLNFVRRIPLAACALLLVFLTLCGAFSVAQDAQEDVSADRREMLLEAAEEIASASEEELLVLREDIREVRLVAEGEAAPRRTRMAELEADLERIGPVPEDGVVEEVAGIEARRQLLQDEFDRLSAIVSEAELDIAEAGRLLIDIANRRRDVFYERVLERDEPPYSFNTVSTALAALSTGWQTALARHGTWKASFDTPTDLRNAIAFLVLGAVLACLLLWPIPSWIDRRLLDQFRSYDPSPARRVVLAALRAISRAVPALFGATLIYQVAGANGVVTDATARLVGSLLLALSTIFVVEDVASAVLAPRQPKWRLVPLESEKARGLRYVMVLIVVVFSANFVLERLAEWLNSPRELVTLLSASAMIVAGGLLFVVARPGLWQLDETGRANMSAESLKFWRWARSLASVAAVASVFAVLVGHVALGRFVLTRMYFLAFLFTGAWFGRALLSELADYIGGRVSHSVSGVDQAELVERGEDRRLLVFWLRLLIDLLVAVAVLPLSFLILGADWADMRNWLFDALFGLKIGGFTISLVNIASAMATVVIIIVITRFVQRTMDRRIFEPARMESGLRNTFRTLIGYLGLIFGIMAAIGTLGFPLANLAIVAGALSVGIGFGLTSIINNFVSGLILLFERPIKVGDWIVTSAGEGIVKRISVRSTEIETFDWASVIIPNSELIAAPVTNWTHKNRYTRLIIPVGVSYDSDPEAVSAILLAEAKANRRTLSFPVPVIYFAGFGDSSLDFEMRIFINNVDDRIPVQNELRIAIFKAFAEAGIEIPFPQRDLHVRTQGAGSLMPTKTAAPAEDEAVQSQSLPPVPPFHDSEPD